MSSRHLRNVVVVIGAGAVCTAGLLGGAASAAGHKGVKGDPQPEMKPFVLSSKDFSGGGSVAILPSGTLIAAYDVPTHDDRGATKVCILPRADRACSHSTTTIVPPAGASNDTTGVPQVFALSAKDVDVLIEDSTSGDLLYRSVNGGSVFGTPVSLGDMVDVDEAVLVGRDIVFSQTNGADGAPVESVSVDAPAAPGQTAIASTAEAEEIGVGSYHGGALVANGSFSHGVILSFAAAGKNFNDTSSYAKVGTFKGESFLGISGDVLLTQSTKGKTPVLLRVFNGHSFGSAHTVPHGSGAGPENYVVDRDPSGEIHVFTVLAQDGYDLEEQSSGTGAHWSSRQVLSNADDSDTFDGHLDAIGSGIILGTNADGQTARAYPVLARQSVSFTLKKSTIKQGHKSKGSGKVRAQSKGRKVELQVEKSGRWFNVTSTHESASGAFSFTIKGKHVGKKSYRAVASDRAGYVQYGYSRSRSLRVKKK